jgi:hypothetical protein
MSIVSSSMDGGTNRKEEKQEGEGMKDEVV